MAITSDNKKKEKSDVTYSHCGKKGPVKEKRFKLIKFPKNFKFTKSKGNFEKNSSIANNVFANASFGSTREVFTQLGQK